MGELELLERDAGAATREDSVCVTYWVNLLQNLPTDPARSRQMFVTPTRRRRPRKTRRSGAPPLHPVFDQAAIGAQAR